MTKWCGVPGPKEIWHTAMDMSWSPVKKLNRAGLPRVRKATGSMVHIEARGGWSMVHGHNSQWLILVWRYVYDLIKRYCILYIIHVYSSKSSNHTWYRYVCTQYIHICIYTYLYTHVQLHVPLTISPRAPLHNINASFHFSRLTFRAIDPFKSRWMEWMDMVIPGFYLRPVIFWWSQRVWQMRGCGA